MHGIEHGNSDYVVVDENREWKAEDDHHYGWDAQSHTFYVQGDIAENEDNRADYVNSVPVNLSRKLSGYKNPGNWNYSKVFSLVIRKPLFQLSVPLRDSELLILLPVLTARVDSFWHFDRAAREIDRSVVFRFSFF